MLDAVEALFLGCADELAVDHERGRRIAVVSVQTEDRRQAEQCKYSFLGRSQVAFRDCSGGTGFLLGYPVDERMK